jgi:protein-tyrosine phosphatase
MINVLFVCLGNICRSPMADAVMAHMVEEAGLSAQIRVDSAGTGGYHVGEKAHRGTLAVLQRKGIKYDGRARQFRGNDPDNFDYILTMDRSNLSNVWRIIPDNVTPTRNTVKRSGRTVVIRPFLHYAHDAGMVDELEVPDPYYSDTFDEVYQLVKQGCAALLDHIREMHGI